MVANGGRLEGQQFGITPMVQRTAGQRSLVPSGTDAVQVVADIEDAIGRAAVRAHHPGGFRRGEVHAWV